MSSKTSSLAIWIVILLLVGASLACTANINAGGKQITIGDAPAEENPPPVNQPPEPLPEEGQPPASVEAEPPPPEEGQPPTQAETEPPPEGPPPTQTETEPPPEEGQPLTQVESESPPLPADQLETLQLPSLDPTGDGLANLGTFRQKMALQFAADQAGYSANYNYNAEVNTGQSAVHIAMNVDGAAASNLPANQMEAIWIGDKVWVKLGNQPWLPVPQSMAEAPFGEQPVSAGAFLPYAPQAQRIEPDETVNGVLSRHYRYNVENLSTEAGTITGNGDIYTAVDGGYVVRYTLNGHGDFQQGLSGSGAINLMYDTYDVGAAISIDKPRW